MSDLRWSNNRESDQRQPQGVPPRGSFDAITVAAHDRQRREHLENLERRTLYENLRQKERAIREWYEEYGIAAQDVGSKFGQRSDTRYVLGAFIATHSRHGEELRHFNNACDAFFCRVRTDANRYPLMQFPYHIALMTQAYRETYQARTRRQAEGYFEENIDRITFFRQND